MMIHVDIALAVKQGSIGALGAIPGTIVSFPLDVIKVHQQSHHRPLSAVGAVSLLSKDSLLRGCGPAVSQKVATRVPMFLFSSLFVQVGESCGLDPVLAAFVGSAGSGYLTGGLAAIFEWQKVVNATSATGGDRSSASSFARSAPAKSVLRRMHFAGARNAVFDSCFFGTKATLQKHTECSEGVAYGVAAAGAVVLDYATDVAVKRSMRLNPKGLKNSREKITGILKETISVCQKLGFGVFRGLPAKVGEFSVSYSVTGLCAYKAMELVEQIL